VAFGRHAVKNLEGLGLPTATANFQWQLAGTLVICSSIWQIWQQLATC